LAFGPVLLVLSKITADWLTAAAADPAMTKSAIALSTTTVKRLRIGTLSNELIRPIAGGLNVELLAVGFSGTPTISYLA